ncbi:MAG: efflux transporter outer membrane subunit [Sphingomonas fennica]
MAIAPRSALALLPLLLAGCTVGPDYAGPPQSPGGTPAGFARATAETPATAVAVAEWWRTLGDPTLDALIARGLAANPDVAVATARLRQARGALRLDRANQAPSVNALAVYAHARLPGIDLGSAEEGDSGSDGGGGTSNLDFYNLGFDASWEIDLFGGKRRTVEAARARLAAAEANRDDVLVTLTAEIATAYVNLRDRQQRIALNRQSVERQQQMLALTEQRLRQGTASRLEVARLTAQLDSTRADITPLNAERDAYLDQLATLTGDAPGTLDATLTPVAALPLPPAAVAIGDPAALLRRRPDVRAAERQLAAETARVGVAEAARFPSISLMGIIGIGGTRLGDLSDLDNFALIAAPQLRWSFLDFGRNRARVEQAKGVRDEAEARYRAAVLVALRDAEGALSRFRYRRMTVATLARAKASADLATDLAAERYRAGTSTLIDLLDSQRQQIAAAQNLSIAEAGLTQDFVAIQKALGLGWAAPA